MVVCYGCHQNTVFGVLTFRLGKSIIILLICFQNQTPNGLFIFFFHALKPLMILLNSGQTFRSNANSREPWHARENAQAIS